MARKLLFTFVALMIFSVPAYSQATRTWVSGVGDDVNPCSRTAPCKTFAGAISKTAINGEISVLDPGGYGTVTITKSLLIDGEGTLASILFSSTNGVIINAAGINVTLRNLSLNGGGTGFKGIRILQAANVVIENCDISNFTSFGISDERTVAGTLTVLNSRIYTGIGINSYGIVVEPAAATANALTFDGVSISGMGATGFYIANGASAMITRSSTHSNLGDGIRAQASLGTVEINVSDSVVHSNSLVGVKTVGAGATVRLANTFITENKTNGLEISGGTIGSYLNNRINGNAGNNGAGLTTVIQQ